MSSGQQVAVLIMRQPSCSPYVLSVSQHDEVLVCVVVIQLQSLLRLIIPEQILDARDGSIGDVVQGCAAIWGRDVVGQPA